MEKQKLVLDVKDKFQSISDALSEIEGFEYLEFVYGIGEADTYTKDYGALKITARLHEKTYGRVPKAELVQLVASTRPAIQAVYAKFKSAVAYNIYEYLLQGRNILFGNIQEILDNLLKEDTRKNALRLQEVFYALEKGHNNYSKSVEGVLEAGEHWVYEQNLFGETRDIIVENYNFNSLGNVNLNSRDRRFHKESIAAAFGMSEDIHTYFDRFFDLELYNYGTEFDGYHLFRNMYWHFGLVDFTFRPVERIFRIAEFPHETSVEEIDAKYYNLYLMGLDTIPRDAYISKDFVDKRYASLLYKNPFENYDTPIIVSDSRAKRRDMYAILETDIGNYAFADGEGKYREMLHNIFIDECDVCEQAFRVPLEEAADGLRQILKEEVWDYIGTEWFTRLRDGFYETDPDDYYYCEYCESGNREDYNEDEEYYDWSDGVSDRLSSSKLLNIHDNIVNLNSEKTLVDKTHSDRFWEISTKVHSYDYQPNFDFQWCEDEDPRPRLYMGVELEMDEAGKYHRAAALINSALSPEGLTYAMSDGSLDCGIEFATMPSSLRAHKEKYDYKTAFKVATALGYRSHDTRTCGLHVHMNKKFFGDDSKTQLYKGSIFALVVERLWDQLVKFSRRDYSRLDNWAKKKNITQRLFADDSIETINNKLISEYGNDRYVAFNAKNNHTFELRIFRGTLKYETYMATLELVNNLGHWVKDHNLNQAQNVTFKNIVDYMETEYLNDYCEERGIFTISDPEPTTLKEKPSYGNLTASSKSTDNLKHGDIVRIAPVEDWTTEDSNGEMRAMSGQIYTIRSDSYGMHGHYYTLRDLDGSYVDFIWYPDMLELLEEPSVEEATEELREETRFIEPVEDQTQEINSGTLVRVRPISEWENQENSSLIEDLVGITGHATTYIYPFNSDCAYYTLPDVAYHFTRDMLEIVEYRLARQETEIPF